MDEEIRKQNKIPGSCEQFTKPEEIKALNKYLRKLKKAYDDNTVLEKDKLGVIGFDGQLIRETPLSTQVEKIETNREVSLSNSVLSVDGESKEVSLSDTVDKISDSGEKSLSTQVDKISDNREYPLSETKEKLSDDREYPLSTQVENLSDNREYPLSETKEKLSDDREYPLSTQVENLSDDRIQTLSRLVEKIGNGKKETSLSKKTEGILNSSSIKTNSLSNQINKLLKENKDLDVELSKHKDTLGQQDIELSLSDKIDTIEDEREYPLSTKIDRIKTDEDLALSDKISDLEVDERIELSDEVDKIKDTRDNKLSDKKDKINPQTKPELSKKVSKINDHTSNSLSDQISKIKNETVQPDLSRKVSQIEDHRDNKLSTDRPDKLNAKNEIPLSSIIDNLDTKLETELSNKVDELSDDREFSLSAYIDNLEDNSEQELSSNVEKLSDDREYPLSTQVDKISDDREYPLSTKKETIQDNSTSLLSAQIEKLSDDREYPLSTQVDKISDDREYPLSTKKETIQDNKSYSLSDIISRIQDTGNDVALSNQVENVVEDSTDGIHKQFDPAKDHLSNTGTKIISNKGGNVEELSNKKSELISSKTDLDGLELSNEVSKIDDKSREDSLSEETEKLIGEVDEVELSNEKQKVGAEEPSLTDFERKLIDYKDLNNYYNNLLNFTKNKVLNKGWASKVSSLISSYLSSGNITEAKAREFEKALYKAAMKDPNPTPMPATKLPKFNINSLNINNYLRFVAEKIIGRNWHNQKWLRAFLLDETLAVLVLAREEGERLKKANRDRLPGNPDILNELITGGVKEGLQDGVKRVKDKVVGLIHGESLEKKYPINRPIDKDTPQTNELGYQTWTKTNSKGESFKGMSLKDIGKKLINAAIGKVDSSPERYEFNENYIGRGAFQGINTTLENLCMVSNVEEIRTVQDLFNVIEKSPYMSTASKVVSGKDSPLKVLTLDSNSFWEIIFEPFVAAENGKVSYLPPIEEINLWNMLDHGVNTGYSRWLPITSFEMQKAKLTTKTAGLFEGEISFPTSLEFSNEFRITISDDQYKSFRNYFEKCMEVSVFNSEPHGPEDYGQDGNNNYIGYSKPYKKLTSVDKNFSCIAPYKNVTFKCSIYCMTPQKGTINRYELLLTLKDLVEERFGEIEASGGDLTVSFSIVGENPSHISSTGSGSGSTQLKMAKSVYEGINNKVSAKADKILNKRPKSVTGIGVIGG